MIPDYCKRTFFANELIKAEKELDCHFDLKKEKFFHNIDSLYYMIKVQQDWNSNKTCRSFVSMLQDLKSEAGRSDDLVMFSDFIVREIGLPLYPIFLESPDRYSVFITDTTKNNTPEIWVQIRSQFLWLYGEHHCVTESLREIEKMLDENFIVIKEVKENRIDFAYHTNYIQDPTNFFPSKELNSMTVTNFKRWSIEGTFEGSDRTDVDYLTMGRKKSNNLFFRAYNKTKEVVEKGYKQFFIELWFQEGLINAYDKYCLEQAFQHQNYNHLNRARLEYYLLHGNDDSLKAHIRGLLSGYPEKYNMNDLRIEADSLMPKVTLILNIEIETKRKFYSKLDDTIETLLELKTDCPPYAKKLFVKLDNKDAFHRILTTDVVRFINRSSAIRKYECDVAYWWSRLQSVKVQRKYSKTKVNLYRQYQSQLDAVLQQKRALRSIASLAVTLNQDDSSDIRQDVVDLLSTLTENQIEDLASFKRKKLAQVANKLSDDVFLPKETEYQILNLTTGELF